MCQSVVAGEQHYADNYVIFEHLGRAHLLLQLVNEHSSRGMI